MSDKKMPEFFRFLLSEAYIDESGIISTSDGFFMVYKSLSDILAKKDILDFPDSDGERLLCNKFYDDWFLYAVPNGKDYTYSLLKMREQEHDTEEGLPADGDMPGITISFISFDIEILLSCLSDSADENRIKLSCEINRVVAARGQSHHKALKRYFKNPVSEAPYLVADVYTKHIASLAENGCLDVSDHYKTIVQQSISYKNSKKASRLPKFMEVLNRKAGYVVCDNEKIFIKNREEPTKYERLAILATHTGNVSYYSFAAEVEYHARYLIMPAKIKLPFFGGSVYDSAIRADMTVGDTEFEGPAPFYKADSRIVRRQLSLHQNSSYSIEN